MQGTVAAHLIKRGIEVANNCYKQRQAQAATIDKWIEIEGAPTPLEQMLERFKSPSAIATLGLTLAAFFLIGVVLEYAIRIVATNLAIVEDTDDTGRIALPISPEADGLSKAALLDDVDGENMRLPAAEGVTRKPVTAKLRSTFQLLASVGGCTAKFRGAAFAGFYQVTMMFFTVVFNAVFAMFGPLGVWMASASAAVLCCNLHATWTHATIAAPTQKAFFQRFIAPKQAYKLILPTLRLQVAMGLMQVIVFGSTFCVVELARDGDISHGVAESLAVLPIGGGLLVGLVLVLPAYIALIRAEAALLPEDMSAIVPFDRTFGGRMAQDIDSKRCRFLKDFTFQGAWTQFSRETYKRVVKMQAKFFGLSLATGLVFGLLFAAEAYLIVGGETELRNLWVYFQAVRENAA